MPAETFTANSCSATFSVIYFMIGLSFLIKSVAYQIPLDRNTIRKIKQVFSFF